MGRKKVLEDELNDLEGKLQRAEKLVTGRLTSLKPGSRVALCLRVFLSWTQSYCLYCHPAPLLASLVAGLAGERVRWESSINGYEGFLAALPGDALLAAAFLSYAGPFPSEFRDELVKGIWVPQVRSQPRSGKSLVGGSGYQAAVAV